MFSKSTAFVYLSICATIALALAFVFFPTAHIAQGICICILILSNIKIIYSHNDSLHHAKPQLVIPSQTENINELPQPAISQTGVDEQLHEAIIANIGQGLVVSDKTGQIILFNKAAQTMLGWTLQEALGKPLHEIIDVNYQSSGSKQNFGGQATLYFVRKDKSTFPAAITSTSYVSGEKILDTITLFRDITTEQNIDSVKNEFISLASHQLRTPLAAIKWYTDMLIKGDAGALSNEQLEYTKNIYSSTNKMNDLVNSLLNISRIESGRLSIEPKPTNLKPFIEEILKEVTLRYAEKHQNFQLHIPDNLPLVNFDQSLIRQVYLNLLTNAAKYTPEQGNIRVTVEQKDGQVISEIKDNGYGIPENEKNRVFDKFYRGANVAEKVTDGTGLGLYLIKAIISLCNGKIWYESQQGEGTTFWFSLPIAGVAPKKGVVTLND